MHNLGIMEWNDAAEPYDWAIRFNNFIKGRIEAGDISAILNFETRGQEADLSVPSPDHFLPLLYVLGARQPEDEPRFLTDFIQYKSLSMTSLILG